MANLTYHEQKDIENVKRLRALVKELPSFCSDFFRGIETTTSTKTRIAYAYDLRIFFEFLRQENPASQRNYTLHAGTADRYGYGGIRGLLKMPSIALQRRCYQR